MKELRGGIIRLFEEGKNANQIATAMNLTPFQGLRAGLSGQTQLIPQLLWPFFL